MGAATPSAPVLVGAPTDPAGPVRLAERAVADAHRLVRAVGGAAEPAGAAWTVLVPPARTVDTLAGLLAEMTGPPARPDLGRLRAAVVALAAAVDPTRDPAELWGRPADPDQPDPDEPADPDGPAVPGGTGTVPDTVDDGDGSDELRGAVVTIRRSALIAAVAEDRRGHGARSSPHPCTRPECAEPARVFDQLRRHRRRHAQALHAAATTGRGVG